MVLYNRRPGHDKVYVVTLWQLGNQYCVVPFYSTGHVWRRSGGDYSKMQVGREQYALNSLTAARVIGDLMTKKINRSGYTVYADGVTPTTSIPSMPSYRIGHQ